MFLTWAVVFLQHSAMAESSAAAVAAAGTAAPTVLDELLEITAQSLVRTEVAEHYEVIRELGRGKYGHVMLVTHRQRGKEPTAPYELLCLPPLARVVGGLVAPQDQARWEVPRESGGTGTSPAGDHPISPSQGAGDARRQPRTSGKVIVMRWVQGQAGKSIHKSGSWLATGTDVI